MSYSVAPTKSDVFLALRSFVQGVIGSAVPVEMGVQNRVAAPLPVPGFVILTPLFQGRLRWNSVSWQLPSPTALSIEQGIELAVQMDFYGMNAFDWAATCSTLFRDPYGCDALAPSCQPLYADEARMVPLLDAEEQYEERWCLDAHLQYNPVVSPAQQFAEALDAILINVEQAFPT